MDQSMQLKLAELTIQDIELAISGELGGMDTGTGKLTAAANALNRYKYYTTHPDRIPDYLKVALDETPIQERDSITIHQRMTIEQFKKLYPEHSYFTDGEIEEMHKRLWGES